MTADLDALAARFLKPDRPRLAAMRELARAGDVETLLAAIPDPYGPADTLAERRWFASDHGRQRHRLPADRRAAALVWSDPVALRRAEDAARELARRLWLVTLRPGPPPVDVVWRTSGFGSIPDPNQPGEPTRRTIPALAELAGIVGVAPVDPDWRPPFAELAAIVAHGWRGEGPDPVSPLIDTFATGLGLWAILPDHLALFVPDRADAPARWSEALARPMWQRAARGELAWACRHGDAAAADRACSRGAPIEGLRVGREPVIDWIAERLAATHSPYGWPSLEAWRALLGVLLRRGLDPGASDDRGTNPLARAVLRGRAEALLAAGFPVDAADGGGRTALHQLCTTSRWPRLVDPLISHGADVNARDALGRTQAVLHGHDAQVAPLLRAGADPHAVTADGSTLYHAATVGLTPGPRARIVDVLVERGVVNRPDRAGRVPVGAGLPDPTEAPVRLRTRAARAPEGLLRALDDRDDRGWAVLADWFQERDDVRGELISRAMRRDPGLAAAMARHRSALLRPFVDAHPFGALIDGAPDVQVTFGRGGVRGLTLSARFADALPELLDHPGADLLDEVDVTALRPTAVARAIPRLAVRRLTLTVAERGRAARPLRIPVERLPLLQALHVRCPDGVVVDVNAPALEVLRLEQPYQPGRRWQHHRIEVPRVHTLEIVAGRAPTEADPGYHWLRALFDDPPPSVRRLALRPVPVALVEALVGSALLPRLTALTLASARAELLRTLCRFARELQHLDALSVSLVGTTRAQREALRAECAAELPALALSGVEFRKAGAY